MNAARSWAPVILRDCTAARKNHRVFALSGDKARAKASYEALWKDADPDLAILRSAEGEYARL
jgi:hypothetical protein